jgi:hypothetical protein
MMAYVACPDLLIVFLILATIGAIKIALVARKDAKERKRILAEFEDVQTQQPKEEYEIEHLIDIF